MFKKEVRNSLETIENKLDALIDSKVDNNLSFELLETKEKSEKEQIKLLKEKMELKDKIYLKDKALEEKDKELEDYKKAVKNLTDEVNLYIKYKNERESLKKEITKLEKENQKLKEKGVKPLKRIRGTGPTKDTKQVQGMKNSKVSGAAKAELKEINKLREKED